ncbi:MAG TPA: GNAT family N-acetyltransferase [Terriglobales bacterium]|nr:GNAT family N-acetyltransferase [Terriglobales bacterium]
MLLKSFLEFKPLYTDAGFAATTPTAEQVLTRMTEGPVWIALHAGEIVGTVAAVLKDKSLYVRGMAVLPAARGVGASRRLLDEVERFARAAHCRRLFLTTTPFLAAAISLYESYGFRRMNHGPQDLFGTPLFTMEKILPGP